jgi:hypothetical protein
MGIEEIQYTVVAVTVASVFVVSNKQAILDVEADGLRRHMWLNPDNLYQIFKIILLLL